LFFSAPPGSKLQTSRNKAWRVKTSRKLRRHTTQIMLFCLVFSRQFSRVIWEHGEWSDQQVPGQGVWELG